MSRLRRLPLSFIIPVLLSLFSVVPAQGADEAYVIGAADVLEVQVWDNKDLNQVVFVRPDGKISLPLLGEIQAGGKTVKELQEALAEAYTKSVKGADVTVIVKEIRSRPVYFIGGFTKPGVEQLYRDLTVLQAVSIAGGLLPTADGDNGFILRGGALTLLDFPGSTFTQALGVNNQGVVVGTYNDNAGTAHGFLYYLGHYTSIDYPASGSTVPSEVQAAPCRTHTW